MQTNDKKNLSYLPLIYGMFFILLGLLLLIRYQPFANDDVFIYFNYARNMAEGRFFAYDVRNIPSEGFTSLLYLLLLTPFEFFNINMMFATFIINLMAIILTCYLFYRLLIQMQILSSSGVMLVIAVFVAILMSDPNIITNLNWGLETFLSPLIVFSAALAIAYACPPHADKRAVNAFFVLLFLAYLIRPETIAFLGLFGVPILYSIKPHRKQVIVALIGFGVVFVTYHALKYLIFGDILPTGFYRKVGGETLGGLRYVLNWMIDHSIPVMICVILTVIVPDFRAVFKRRSVWLLLGVSLVTLLFFIGTNPLIGTGYRFLMNVTFTLYSLIAVGVGLFVEKRLNLSDKFLTRALAGITVVFVLLMPVIADGNLLKAINIYARADRSVSQHFYVQFGEYLHQSLSTPEEITLVFGDAGAIPYALQGTFIDTNGLTEPPLARLFRQPDSPEKIATYVDHILSYDPEIVVLAWGATAEGVSQTQVNTHSPFDVPTPIELYTAYDDHNIIYACSLEFYYDLHIGLWRDSPHYDELNAAISTICDEQGYILENGLTITDGNLSIRFDVDKD